MVKNVDSSSRLMFLWPCRASSLETRMDPCSLGGMSSNVGTGWCPLLMALLRSFGSKQTINLQFGFSLITRELTQSD